MILGTHSLHFIPSMTSLSLLVSLLNVYDWGSFTGGSVVVFAC